MICHTGQICIVQSPTMNFICFTILNLNYTVFVSLAHMEVTSGLKGMKKGRAPGWDEMRAEMVDVAGEIDARWTKTLLSACMTQCNVPEDWRIGLIVPIWKRKGDAQDPGKYRGITLLSHIMKLLERILDKRLREKFEHKLGEEQPGFRKGRGTTDGMFSPLHKGNQRKNNFPQGSVLAPSFFNVYISDLPPTESLKFGYADDWTLSHNQRHFHILRVHCLVISDT